MTTRRHAGARQLLAQMLAQLQILVQQLGVVVAGEPAAVPGAVDAEPQPDRIDFLTHGYAASCAVGGSAACSRSATTIFRWLNHFSIARGAAAAARVEPLHHHRRARPRRATRPAGRRRAGGCSRRWRSRSPAPCCTSWAMRRLLKVSVATASPAGRLRISAGDQVQLARADAHVAHDRLRLGVGQSRADASACSSQPRFAFLSAGWPVKVRVGENSPNLCPTMFSVTCTGRNLWPL